MLEMNKISQKEGRVDKDEKKMSFCFCFFSKVELVKEKKKTGYLKSRQSSNHHNQEKEKSADTQN